ncbi:DUF4288 domain-containing protein [Viridibacterium curvum]|uniref:DUF4288 domain-containing protein n=1 Tax=Viridibacterium curvum TaxID=1101404 RepID=A0ABP9QF80_9RHOO
MPWYAIRTVYKFGEKPNGNNVFEERVVCFNAESWTDAHKKAALESKAYEEQGGFTSHPEQVGYEQDGENLIDGYELWSELFESEATLEDFYSNRYAKFKYTPEPPVS